MKTKYFIFAAAAALFAACSSDDSLAPEQQQQTAQSGQVPVMFDNYVNRATRAGMTGIVNYETLKTSGFGVFAYYTNADSYDQTFTPNFMYNQEVKHQSGWKYTPVKYWPNEFGDNAFSEDVDKVSFFAYAPYVTVNPVSGKVKFVAKGGTGTDKDDPLNAGANGDITMGIVGMTRNNTTGDPMVKYISTFYTDEQVDLTWGTVPTSPSWDLKNTQRTQTLTAGTPWKDVEHPKTTSTTWDAAQKVTFNFLHALASLNVQVDTKVNNTTPASVAAAETGKTKVFIRSVTFEGFDTKGALNLNNGVATIANWYNFNCEDELNNGAETTIKDGRKDSKEGVTAATSENALINPTFVQDKVFGSTTAGVTGTPGNLFRLKTATGTGNDATYAPTASAPIYVIPNGDKLKVTIEYDVLTADNQLAGKLNDGQTPGSVVKNVITRYISTAATANNGWGTTDGESNFITLENGKQYTIQLHLGLNSVEFNTTVKDWSTPEEGQADLPHNNQTGGSTGGARQR